VQASSLSAVAARLEKKQTNHC